MRNPSQISFASAVMAMLCGFVWFAPAHAQMPADGPTAAPMPPPRAAGVREIQPQVFYLKDKNGNLVEMPADLTYEDVKEYYDIKHGIKSPAPPAFTIAHLSLTGRAVGNKVEWSAEVKVNFVAKSTGWTRVPLRFAGTVLREPAKREGNGEFYLDYEGEGEGFVAWFRDVDQGEQLVRLKLLSSVQENSGEAKLALAAPRATSGLLSLTTPIERAEARCLRRSGEPEVLEVKPADGGSQLEVLGPAGDLTLTWRAATAASPRLRQVLKASTLIQAKLEGRRRVTCDAKLTVSSFNAPLEAFTVRLPAGMQLISVDQPNARFTVLEPELDPLSKKLSQIVEVRLATKSTAPVEVTLSAESIYENNTPTTVDLGGFEVVDAVKQAGTVDLSVDGEYSAIWVEGANVRQVDLPSPADATANVNAVARFEFDAQPFSLQTQIAPRKTRIAVEPTYVVFVDGSQLRLEATLKYRVRGAKTGQVQYNLRDWTIDRIGPESHVQTDALQREESAPLTIPLAAAAIPSTGEFELKIQAHRPLTAATGVIEFDLPQPVGGVSTLGSLVIVPADNIELTSRAGQWQGLTPDALPAAIKLPVRQQQPYFFRELGGSAARFAAEYQVRERSVTVVNNTSVRLDPRGAQVTQNMVYSVAYEPLRHIECEMPKTLWENGQLQILLDGRALRTELVPLPNGNAVDNTAATVSSPRVRVRADLLAERIGRLELEARYRVNLPETDNAFAIHGSLPLIGPIVDDAVAVSPITLNLTHDAAWDVIISDKSWAAGKHSAISDEEDSSEWSHVGGAQEVPFQLARKRTGNQTGALVDKVWLQTWLAPGGRQDRAVYRVTTNLRSLRIQLPPAIRPDSVQAAIDGRQTSFTLDGDFQLYLDLPSQRANPSQVIELWYESTSGRRAGGAVALAAPLVVGGSEAQRAYWQVVVPQNEHLVVDPTEMSADMSWRFRPWLWERSGELSQRDLEAWIGASTQADLPRGTNAYLFSSFGSPDKLNARFVARRTVLLACSGLALVAGLTLIYLPAARHPILLLLAGLAIVGCGLWSPDLAILTGQAAAAGLLCVLLARLLVALTGPRGGRALVLRESAGSAIESKATELPQNYEGSSQATTAAGPLMVAASSPENMP